MMFFGPDWSSTLTRALTLKKAVGLFLELVQGENWVSQKQQESRLLLGPVEESQPWNGEADLDPKF